MKVGLCTVHTPTAEMLISEKQRERQPLRQDRTAVHPTLAAPSRLAASSPPSAAGYPLSGLLPLLLAAAAAAGLE
jgi:hypothetical protein